MAKPVTERKRPYPDCEQAGTGELMVLLCLDEAGQSPQIPTPQENPSDLLGLMVENCTALEPRSPTTMEKTWVLSM